MRVIAARVFLLGWLCDIARRPYERSSSTMFRILSCRSIASLWKS